MVTGVQRNAFQSTRNEGAAAAMDERLEFPLARTSDTAIAI